MKKKLLSMIFGFWLSLTALASVPTEEGLLLNLNNADLPGQFITVKMMLQTLEEPGKYEYVKFQLTTEDKSGSLPFLQTIYSSGQMLNAQIKNVKFFPDLLTQIRKEKSPEKSMFYAVLMMLTTNRAEGMEAFLEKNGIMVVKNKTILNEEKMRLLRAYRSYLISSKGKVNAVNPLTPEDPKNKEKVLELFRANTFKRASNIEMVKKDNEFMWKVDWKVAQGYFSNELRQLRAIEYSTPDAQIKLESSQYLLFNGTNELPKFINIKSAQGQIYKLQTLGLDIKRTDKTPAQLYEEYKKIPGQIENTHPFLF